MSERLNRYRLIKQLMSRLKKHCTALVMSLGLSDKLIIIIFFSYAYKNRLLYMPCLFSCGL